MPTEVINLGKHLKRYQAISLGAQERGAKNRIYRVGIELEGGWSKLPKGVTALEHDGSVQVPDPGARHQTSIVADPYTGQPTPRRRIVNSPTWVTGELPSGPLEVHKIEPFLNQNYPTAVNESCGMHVHMSFKSGLHYQRLMTPNYQGVMIAYLKEWAEEEKFGSKHHIWKRLNGENQYCKLEYFADIQASQESKSYRRTPAEAHRYTAINYAFKQHGTLECRVLPMMNDAKLAFKAIKRVLDITNAFLSADKQREERLYSSIDFVEAVQSHSKEELAQERYSETYGGQ